MHGSAANQKSDIVDTARSEASFRKFLSALQAAPPMVDYLKGAGPFTVFLPTDEAFDALPAGSLEQLEKPENQDRLTKLLKYHIVEGAHSSNEVKTMQTMLTTSGDKLAVESDGSGIRINNAQVLGRDILCTNGIIHVVGAVLLGF